jgi:hypothetical protein
MLSTMVNNYMVRGALYNLRKLFGKQATVYKRLSVTTDAETGICTPYYSKYNIIAIVLPEDGKREAIYDSTYLRSSRAFQYGAMFDTGMVEIIIDRNEYRNTLTTDDYITVAEIRYDVLHVEATADNRAILAITKQAVNAGVQV